MGYSTPINQRFVVGLECLTWVMVEAEQGSPRRCRSSLMLRGSSPSDIGLFILC